MFKTVRHATLALDPSTPQPKAMADSQLTPEPIQLDPFQVGTIHSKTAIIDVGKHSIFEQMVQQVLQQVYATISLWCGREAKSWRRGSMTAFPQSTSWTERLCQNLGV